MSWSDLFYPGNPERRESLIRKDQEIKVLMSMNFYATNQLIETLEKHLSFSFSPIALNEKATVKENCDIIIERIQEIQAEVEKIDMKLKEKLEPVLYEKLRNMSLSVPEYELVSTVVHEVSGSAALASAGYLIAWLITGNILVEVKEIFGKIGQLVIGVLALGVFFAGIDMIVQAIVGNIERDDLEKALIEYDKALEEFRPASEKYQFNIMYVKMKIDDMK